MSQGSQIRIWLFSQASMVKAGDPVSEALIKDPQLAPEYLGLFEPFNVKLDSMEALDLWQSEARQEVGILCGERKRPVQINLTVSFGMTPQRSFHTLFWSAESKAINLRRGVERIEELFHRLVEAFDPYWGACFHSDDFERQNVMRDHHHPDGSIEPYRIVGVDPKASLPGLYWLNFFGEVLSDFITRQAIHAAAPAVQSVGKGFLIKLSDSPTEMLDPKNREKADRVRITLGEDLFFDIHEPNRPVRAPQLTAIPPLTQPEFPTHIPSIKVPNSFIMSTASRDSAWRRQHGVGADFADTLRVLEAELDALGFHAPSEEMLGDLAAVLGQLVIERAGGDWVAADEPYVMTSVGLGVYPISQILKRAVDPDASLANWLDEAAKRGDT